VEGSISKFLYTILKRYPSDIN